MRIQLIGIVILSALLVSPCAGQDSLNVTKIGEMFSPDDAALDLAVSGNYALVINRGFWLDYNRSCLRIVDVSNPSQPRLQSTLRMPNYPEDICTVGNYAFIALSYHYPNPGGLLVVDFSDPQNPLPVLSDTSFRSLTGISIHENFLYALGNGVLHVMNIADPANPTAVGSYAATGLTSCIAFEGNRAYLSGSAGLRVLDISNPAAPVELGSVDTLTSAGNITVTNNIVFAASAYWLSQSWLAVIDFSDPANPLFLGTTALPDYCNGITISGNHAYVAAADSGLRIWDISTPALPVESGVYDRDTTWAGETVIVGNLAYVAFCGDGLRILDISDPSDPEEVGCVTSPGWSLGIALRDTLAFIASDYAGLTVVNIANPQHPREQASIRLGTGSNVAVNGDHAYVINGSGQLTVFDVSVPVQPTAVGFWSISGYTTAIEIIGNFACLACRDSGLVVLDVSDPTDPVEAATYSAHGNVNDLAVSGTLVYLACTDGMVILDMIDPAAPVERGILDSIGSLGYIGVSNGLACVYGWPVMTVVDVSNPLVPILQGTFSISSSSIKKITMAGRYAYIANDRFGLRVIDLSDPLHPVESGYYITPDYAHDVAVRGDTAFVAACSHIGIYNFTAPTPVASHFVAQPSDFSLAAYPNPFNPISIISFSLPRAAHTELKIYDITGRLVQTLASRVFDAGSHSLTFDGSQLASGLYLCRMEAAGHSQTQKLVLLK